MFSRNASAWVVFLLVITVIPLRSNAERKESAMACTCGRPDSGRSTLAHARQVRRVRWHDCRDRQLKLDGLGGSLQLRERDFPERPGGGEEIRGGVREDIEPGEVSRRGMVAGGGGS